MIYVKHNLPQTLPELDGDEIQLGQAIVNIVANAGESIENETRMMTILTGAIQVARGLLTSMLLDDDLNEGPCLYLEVTDTGCGMARETQKRLFAPFFSTKFSGRGLGLASTLGMSLVRTAGACACEAEPSSGTAVTVFSPVSESANPDVLHPAMEARQVAPAASEEPVEVANSTPAPIADSVVEDAIEDYPLVVTDPKLVLVADDDESLRKITAMMLRKLKYELPLAEGRERAQEVYRESGNQIGVVPLDLSMLGINGEEAFRELRKITPRISVLLERDGERKRARERCPHGRIIEKCTQAIWAQSSRKSRCPVPRRTEEPAGPSRSAESLSALSSAPTWKAPQRAARGRFRVYPLAVALRWAIRCLSGANRRLDLEFACFAEVAFFY